MQDAELRRQVVKLRVEIDRLDPRDDAGSARLHRLLSDIERQLSRPEDSEHHATLIADVRAAIQHFEVEHPRTTAILNQIMMALSNMGI